MTAPWKQRFPKEFRLVPEHGLHARVISDTSDLLSLRAEWDDLYRRAENPRLSQSFEWAWSVWSNLAQPNGGRLRTVVVRRSGRLVLVWPMVVTRHRRLWSIATSLATPEDYATDMLAEPAPDLFAIASRAWRELRDGCKVDFIRLERVRAGSLLERAVLGDEWRQVAAQTSPWLAHDAYPDWQSYWKSRGKSLRERVDRLHRRLCEQGQVSFRKSSSPDETKAIIRWTLERKKEWLIRKKARSRTIESDLYANLLMKACDGLKTFGNIAGFTLTCNGEIIAAQISLVDRSLVENIHIAFDEKFKRFTPGIVLDKHVLQWTIDNHLSYDFHFGIDDRKRRLASASCGLVTCHLYLSAWGSAYEYSRRAWYSRAAVQLRPLRADAVRP
ncbi:GNAT family N-acetyltransferase [Methylobacterium nigriterrae]|uniref:GNAT family N-acetyltransferase n=1 Tax=Methylobacterium nigriterrae TaxID=3127512 RepID=UPI0030139CCA